MQSTTTLLITQLYSVIKHKRRLCSKEIIDIKTYLTNIQTPHLRVGRVCVRVCGGRCGREQCKNSQYRRKKRGKRESTYTHIQRLSRQYAKYLLSGQSRMYLIHIIINFERKQLSQPPSEIRIK